MLDKCETNFWGRWLEFTLRDGSSEVSESNERNSLSRSRGSAIKGCEVVMKLWSSLFKWDPPHVMLNTGCRTSSHWVQEVTDISHTRLLCFASPNISCQTRSPSNLHTATLPISILIPIPYHHRKPLPYICLTAIDPDATTAAWFQ